MLASTMAEDSEVGILSRILDAQNGNLPREAARSWLALSLPDADKARLQDLSARAKEEALSADEAVLLENYLHVGRLIDLMRSKARLSLAQAGS